MSLLEYETSAETMAAFFGVGTVKKILKFSAIAILIALIAQTVWVFPILFPALYFDNKFEYANYTVYSDEEIISSTQSLLQEVTDRLEAIGINEPNRHYGIFLCRRLELYGKFAKIMKRNPRSQGMTTQPLRHTFVSLASIEKTRANYDSTLQYTLLEGDTAHIIAHELVHELTASKLGFLKMRSLPDWKREGYAEYAASRLHRTTNTDYAFKGRLGHFYSGRYDMLPGAMILYIRSGLLVEYLFDVQGLKFETLMNSKISEKDALSDMNSWYIQNQSER